MASGPASQVTDWQTVQSPAVNDWQPVTEKPSAMSQVGTSLKNQAKGLFDTLTTLVDPVMAEKMGSGLVDASIEQWNHAKAAAKAGNYGEAVHRALTTVPIVGPMVQSIIDKAPERPYEAATDVLAIPAALALTHGAPAAADAAGITASALKKGASVAGTVAKDYATDPAILKAGLRTVSPRAAAAVDLAKATANRTAELKDKVADASRRYDRAQPLPPSDRAPIWQNPGTPAVIPPGPVDPTIAPQPRPIAGAPPPATAPSTRLPLWRPIGPQIPEAAPIPVAGPAAAPVLPSGRLPGKPAFDTTTGEILKGGTSQGHFEAPAPAAPAPAPPAAAPVPEPAAQITQIPPTEHPGAVDFAAKARAARDANVGPVADTLEAGGLTAELARQLKPKDWLRLSKADGLGVNIPPKLAAAVIDELESRAAARDLAKAQQGTQAAADASTRAEATRRETMIAPSAAYAEALQRPGALAAAQALADEMNGVASPGKKAFAAKRARAAK